MKSKTPKPVSKSAKLTMKEVPKSAPPPKKRKAFDESDNKPGTKKMDIKPSKLFQNGGNHEEEEMELKRKIPQRVNTPKGQTPKRTNTPSIQQGGKTPKGQKTPAALKSDSKTPTGGNAGKTPKGQKTPAAVKTETKTPAGGNTGKTPKGQKTPAVGSAGKTPIAQKTPAAGNTGKTPKGPKTPVAATPAGKTPKGQKTPSVGSAGKTPKGTQILKTTPGKKIPEPDSDLEDDDDLESDEEEESDLSIDMDDIDDDEDDNDDDDDEEDDDDDNEEDDDDDNDDDDDESIDEDEFEQNLMTKLKTSGKLQMKSGIDDDDDDDESDESDDDDEGENDIGDEDDDSDEDDDEEDESEEEDDSSDEVDIMKDAQKKKDSKTTLTQLKSSDKTNIQKINEKQSTVKQTKVGESDMKKNSGKQAAALDKSTPEPSIVKTQDVHVKENIQRRDDYAKKTLFIGGFTYAPEIADKLKKLSKDVLSVRLHKKFKGKEGVQGTAFLQFASEQMAEKNFHLLKGKKIDGKELKVDFVGEKSINKKADNQKQQMSGSTDPLKLYVSGYPLGTTEKQLRGLFKDASKIDIPRRRDKQIFGFAFVHFTTEGAAKKAFDNKGGHVLNGSQLIVYYATSKKQPRDVKDAVKRKPTAEVKEPQSKKPKITMTEEDDDDDDSEEEDDDDDDEDEDDDDDDNEEEDDDDDDDDDEEEDDDSD